MAMRSWPTDIRTEFTPASARVDNAYRHHGTQYGREQKAQSKLLDAGTGHCVIAERADKSLVEISDDQLSGIVC